MSSQEENKGSWRDTARFFLFLFIAAVALRSLVVASFTIPSGSMLPTLRIGDYLFAAKWPYGYSRYSFPFNVAGFEGRLLARPPQRGDIAVFRYPGKDVDFVKRVIGLPGDTIAMENGRVVLNGKRLALSRAGDFLMPVTPNSPCRAVSGEMVREVPSQAGAIMCSYPQYLETLPGGRSYYVLDQTSHGPGDFAAPVTVPQGHVFVMGDNRDDSLDSRFSIAEDGVGMLPIENLQGPAKMAFFSTDGSAEWIKPWTWITAARWERIGRILS